MPRGLDSTMLAELAKGEVRPCFLADLTLRSGVQYVWTGTWPLTWNGHTYTGVGTLAGLGAVSESSAVQADGSTLSLLGSLADLQEALTEVRVGAPVSVWFGMLSPAAAIVGSPFEVLSGLLDEPDIDLDPTGTKIVLAIENRLRDHQRASGRRYTAADQKIEFPNDSGFNWVEILNEISLKWGS